MGKGREWWLYETHDGYAAFDFYARDGREIIHVREVVEGESPTQPTELEMHRADHQAVKAAGFECVGELLAAYNVLLAIAGNVHQKPQAWLLIMDGACAGVYRFERDAKEAGIDAGVKFDLIPLYANQITPAKVQSGIQPDHSAALAEAAKNLRDDMETIAAGGFRIPVREYAMHALHDYDCAYRASQKGGA